MGVHGPRSCHAPAVPLVLVAALLWATLGLFSRELLDDGVSAVVVGFWRAVVGGGLFAAHATVRRRWRRPARGDVPLLVGFALVGVTVFFVALPAAVDTGGVSLAWILLYTAPAFVVVLAPLVLGERVTRTLVVLAAATVAGVVLVATGGGTGVHVSAASIAWGLVSGASYASYYLVGKRLLERLDPVLLGALVLPIGALGLLPALLTGDGPRTARQWLLVLGLGVVATYLPYLAYYAGVRRVAASRAVVVATVEPVAAVVLAAAVYDERLGVTAAVGAAVILVAATIAGRIERA